MNIRLFRWSLLLAALVSAPPAARAEEDLFASCSFEDALKRAGQEHKLVFIDFYTTWCAPCKMLDQTTWKDPKVIAFLREKTIPLRIDSEAQRKLAQRFDFEAVPTLLFLKPDGTEMDRISGYRDSAGFLSEAEAILSGKDAIVRAKEELKQKGENDPMARMAYARTLRSKGRKEEALKEYLWCFDEGKKSPAFFGVRLSFLLSEVSEFGRSYPPALEALRQRRDATRKQILGGRPEAFSFMDLRALNQNLQLPDDTLAVYDQFKREHADSPLLPGFRRQMVDELLKARRYEELYANEGFEAEIDQALEMLTPSWTAKLFTMQIPKEQREEMERIQKKIGVQKLGGYYQVLLGLRKLDEAGKLAARILKVDSSAETYNTLAWSGYLTGDPVEENVAQARKAHELSGGKDAAVVDTLARVLNARGQRREAVSILRQARSKLDSPQDQAIVDRCLADLEQGPPAALLWTLGIAGGLVVLIVAGAIVQRRRARQVSPQLPAGPAV